MKKTVFIIWIFLAIMALLDIFMKIPTDKYQKNFLDMVHKRQKAPQERIDATYKFVDAFEDGTITFDEHATTNLSKQPVKTKKVSDDKYAKPRYIRDKNNPKILHPYK